MNASGRAIYLLGKRVALVMQERILERIQKNAGALYKQAKKDACEPTV